MFTDIELEPRLMEYLRKKREYKNLGHVPSIPLEREFCITDKDYVILKKYLRGETEIYTRSNENLYSDKLRHDKMNFRGDRFKQDPRYDRLVNKMQKEKQANTLRHNTDSMRTDHIISGFMQNSKNLDDNINEINRMTYRQKPHYDNISTDEHRFRNYDKQPSKQIKEKDQNTIKKVTEKKKGSNTSGRTTVSRAKQYDATKSRRGDYNDINDFFDKHVKHTYNSERKDLSHDDPFLSREMQNAFHSKIDHRNDPLSRKTQNSSRSKIDRRDDLFLSREIQYAKEYNKDFDDDNFIRDGINTKKTKTTDENDNIFDHHFDFITGEKQDPEFCVFDRPEISRLKNKSGMSDRRKQQMEREFY